MGDRLDGPVPRQQPVMVSAGTQVVLQSETPDGGCTRPVGAVAVVVEPPVNADGPYRVRFVDGSETLLERDRFSVRKLDRDLPAMSGRDRFGELERWVILRAVVGSRAYGLETDASDTDRRGIYLPPASLHWSLTGVPEQIERDPSQEAYWELQKAITLALRANPTVLETLWSPMVETVVPPADELLAERHRLLSRMAYQTHSGYVLSQFKRIAADIRTTGDVRWKHVMHLLRLLLAGIAVLRDGTLRLDVGEHRARLLAVRAGEVPWVEVDAWRRRLHHELDDAYRRTTLPERPDLAWAEDFLVRARHGMVDR